LLVVVTVENGRFFGSGQAHKLFGDLKLAQFPHEFYFNFVGIEF
jgi:hypothetical protein